MKMERGPFFPKNVKTPLSIRRRNRAPTAKVMLFQKEKWLTRE
jgi:hypothetical protein